MLRYLIAFSTLCFIVWLILSYSGKVIVHDKTGLVEAAQITNSKWHQRLFKLPFGYFVGIPDMEGKIEVRCSDGSRASGGYVTKHWQESITVIGEGTCEKLV